MFALRALLPKTQPLRAAAMVAAGRQVGPALFARSYASGALERQEIEKRIIDLIRGFDKVASAEVTSESHFTKDLGLDSLDTVEVVMAIEEEFAIEISDKDADSIMTVKQAIDYIAARQDAY
ncbi:putative acyl carrier protein [Catenaria anguillulae PL171]|uniref:Acyl carrier protein n=1 Tax=Catenaria anguillulae PL171 TaxID=765915 RepID=A0A1Y2HKB4_9FUNG|nr:putative acyl carrier protein [Catenaria anguillulae PL171]ORZ34133.1 putative acyl carrier protein [Catenaria anguillulae PL171]